jgi:hypothetical protein
LTSLCSQKVELSPQKESVARRLVLMPSTAGYKATGAWGKQPGAASEAVTG